MGRLKQLLPWGGATLLEWQVDQMIAAGVDDVIVVLGHEAAAIEEATSRPAAHFVLNEAYREGRASSLRCGADAIAPPVDAVAILGVDQPRPAWLTRLLIERQRETGAAVVQARLDGRRSHPLVVSGALLGELGAVREADLGLRAVIERHAAETAIVPVERAGLDVDLNTPAEYEAALAAFGRGEWAAAG